MVIDLNCDLGEGEPLSRTRALMRQVTSANIACGGHAGDAASMTTCVALALAEGVRIGAHPGLPSRSDFGRGWSRVTAAGLERILSRQLGALARVAMAQGGRLHHVKLHGALYHSAETDAGLSLTFVEQMRQRWPSLKIYARAGGRVAAIARARGVEVWEEVFLDRAYREDGTLVPRGEPGAVLHGGVAAAARLRCLLRSGELRAQSGHPLRVHANTLCVHSDTRGALTVARLARGILDRFWRRAPGASPRR
jgi:UPF0271 protein